ncbi:MAG: helix-turn-helix transcriptional regulator, partial [Candidatus Babeliales bacterium]
TFESFLEQEGILEEVNVAAIKAVIAKNLQEYMTKMNITQTEMAKQLKTSRTGLKRLLDPENYSVTLLTLNRAASILGKKVTIHLVHIDTPKEVSNKLSKK